MKVFYKRIIKSILLGYIFMYYSELIFWSRFRPNEDSLNGYIRTWVVYSIAAYLFLIVVQSFKACNFHSIFLCGAFYGWFIEGFIVTTVYDALPFQISFTALAWHALVTVMFGWYYMRRIMSNVKKLLVASTVTGLLIGFWSIHWWGVDNPSLSPSNYVIFIFVSTLILVFFYILHEKIQIEPFKVGKLELITILTLGLVFFILNTVRINPLALVILPLLMGITFFGLSINKKTTDKENFYSIKRIPNWKYFCIMLIPLTATLFHVFSYIIGIRFPTNQIIFVLTTPTGFVLYIISLVKVIRNKT